MTNKTHLKLIEKISKSTYKLHDLLKEKPVTLKKRRTAAAKK